MKKISRPPRADDPRLNCEREKRSFKLKLILSGPTGVRPIVRPVPNAASSNGLPSTNHTSPPTSNSFTQDFGQIINQGFELANKAHAQPTQPLRQKPPLPQKPKKS